MSASLSASWHLRITADGKSAPVTAALTQTIWGKPSEWRRSSRIRHSRHWNFTNSSLLSHLRGRHLRGRLRRLRRLRRPRRPRRPQVGAGSFWARRCIDSLLIVLGQNLAIQNRAWLQTDYPMCLVIPIGGPCGKSLASISPEEMKVRCSCESLDQI